MDEVKAGCSDFALINSVSVIKLRVESSLIENGKLKIESEYLSKGGFMCFFIGNSFN